jgi:hypothetical protein
VWSANLPITGSGISEKAAVRALTVGLDNFKTSARCSD